VPTVELSQQQRSECLRATATFTLGLDGDDYKGLPQELYLELLGFLMPPWADKGPEGAEAGDEEQT
jgi:hypothetical protein